MANLREVAKAVEKRAGKKLARGTIDLPLPIFGGEYGARFGVLNAERLAEFEDMTSNETVTAEEALEVAADFVADSCRVILARPEDGKDFAPLEHDDGRPVRFDQDFAEALGLEPPDGQALDSMTDVVYAVWTTDTGEVNPAALNRFAIRLLNWSQNTSRKVEGELAGESRATRP